VCDEMFVAWTLVSGLDLLHVDTHPEIPKPSTEMTVNRRLHSSTLDLMGRLRAHWAETRSLV